MPTVEDLERSKIEFSFVLTHGECLKEFPQIQMDGYK